MSQNPLHVDRRTPNEFLRDITADQRLVRQGLAGQQAGPPGFGPEPLVVQQPGGDILNAVQHPAFETFERLFRVAPEQDWFNARLDARRPVKFDFGEFEVPASSFFLLMDYEFTPLRQSGLDPWDFVYAEEGRFSGFMGFDLTVSGRRLSNLLYQLNPAQQSFTRSPFAQVNANTYAAVSGDGTSLLPVTSKVQGPRGLPFTLLAGPGSRVALSCVIFRRITAPLSGIQARLSGYQIHQNTALSLIERVRPR
jgi:hypothetical protein